MPENADKPKDEARRAADRLKDEADRLGEKFKDEAEQFSREAREHADKAFDEIKVASNEVVDKVRELIEEGNARHISIRKGDRTLLDIPLTVGVGAGAAAILIAPILSAVGALVAVISDVTLVVEREPEGAPDDTNEDETGEPAKNAEKTVGRERKDEG